MKKLIDSVMKYKDINDLIDKSVKAGLHVGNGLISYKNEKYDEMIREYEKLRGMIYCVCKEPEIRNNGQVIICLNCGHEPEDVEVYYNRTR